VPNYYIIILPKKQDEKYIFLSGNNILLGFSQFFDFFDFIVPKGFQHKVMETLCTEKCYGKLAFQTLFVQDVYAAKSSKTFWY